MLEVLNKAAANIHSKLNISFKPHPLTSVDLDLFPDLKIKEVNEPIQDIHFKFDYAYCSSQTSASLDASFLGMNVLNFSHPISLNLHPLYNLTDIVFVRDWRQLTLALNEQRNQTPNLPLDQFFNLEKNLNKWLSFIEGEIIS